MLESALGTWNERLGELWELLTQTPRSFKGGDIWDVIVNINSAVQGIAYGLLVMAPWYALWGMPVWDASAPWPF